MEIFGAAACLVAAPAAAVGLGPLVLTRSIDGPRQGYWLNLRNSDAQVETLKVYAIGYDDETPQSRVAIFPSEAALGGFHARKVFVVAGSLQIGETYRFRVCAEPRAGSAPIMVRARVCAKLSAYRVR